MNNMSVLDKIRMKCERDRATFIEESYIRSNIPFKFICRCGVIKETTWASLWKTRCKALCEECSKFEFSKKQINRVKEKTFKHISEVCNSYGIFPILETYKGYNKIMLFICSCDNIFKKSWKDLSSKNSYPYCDICKIKYGESKSKNSKDNKHRIRILKEIQQLCKRFNVKPYFEYYKNKDTKLKLVCKCGNIFEQSYLSMRMGRPVLCKECHKETISGEHRYNWNSALTWRERLKYRYLSEFVKWSKEIKRINNYTCQVTGQKEGNLVSHHLYSWDKYESKRFDLKNGVCIRKEIHTEFHNRYGYGDNTLEQFEEFCDRILRGVW